MAIHREPPFAIQILLEDTKEFMALVSSRAAIMFKVIISYQQDSSAGPCVATGSIAHYRN
ncbi:hypothetical protein N7526_007495 [Penicillium atrosanguineum]|nr:hypothetical protein N7526_007495 [Penicillium atrosanguineum]